VGIKELKELVVFMAVLAGAADRSTKNGLGLDDVAYFMPVFLKAPAAFEGIDKAKLEAGDLTPEELTELNSAVAEALDLVDDRVEAIVEKSLAALLNIYSIVQEVKALKA
jgi:hypothetical protein